MKKRLIPITIALLSVTGCLQKPEAETSGVLTLRATLAEGGETRTQLNTTQTGRWDWQISFRQIVWNRTDELNVFSGTSAAGRFGWSGSYGQYGGGAIFTGTLNGSVSETASPRYWAFYPYHPDNVFDGESVTFTLPAEQEACRGSFKNGLFPHLATGNSLDNMSFYNICGGACFSVTRTSVQSVVFRSNRGEPLAGKVRCGIDGNGLPVLKEVLEGIDSVVVSASPNALIPDNRFNYYFAVMLPQTLSEGLTITLRMTDGKALYIPIRKTMDISRSNFGYLQDMDTYAQGDTQAIPIHDMNLRSALIRAFDTDKDGVLSISEAAAVSAGSLFSVLRDIYVDGLGGIGSVCTSFEEFRFFTGVKAIPLMGFEYWSKASRIILPESITSIGLHAFGGCCSLTDLTIPAQVRTIDGFAFDGCSRLDWIVMKPTTPPTAGTNIFNEGTTFPIFVPDTSVEAYKAAENWTAYADRIKPMSEFPGGN